jgi:hypothetical protein
MRSAGPTTLAPLEAEAALRLRTWLPKLHYPIRVGEHSQTAFAFGLVHDWAAHGGNAACSARRIPLAGLLRARTGTARWPTSHRAKTFSRRASRKPT